jgi:hypothetical protein
VEDGSFLWEPFDRVHLAVTPTNRSRFEIGIRWWRGEPLADARASDTRLRHADLRRSRGGGFSSNRQGVLRCWIGTPVAATGASLKLYSARITKELHQDYSKIMTLLFRGITILVSKR